MGRLTLSFCTRRMRIIALELLRPPDCPCPLSLAGLPSATKTAPTHAASYPVEPTPPPLLEGFARTTGMPTARSHPSVGQSEEPSTRFLRGSPAGQSPVVNSVAVEGRPLYLFCFSVRFPTCPRGFLCSPVLASESALGIPQ